jgi:hypothetical protein
LECAKEREREEEIEITFSANLNVETADWADNPSPEN